MTRPRQNPGGMPTIEVRDSEIPGWVKELRRPAEPPLTVVFTRARHECGWLKHYEWAPFFRELVETLFQRVGKPPYLGDRANDFIAVLDLAPALLTHGDEILPSEQHQRLQLGVTALFTYRAYTELDAHRQRLGKRPSGDDLVVHRLYVHARLAGLTDDGAIAEVRKEFPHLSAEGVRSADRRAKRGPFHTYQGRFQRLDQDTIADALDWGDE